MIALAALERAAARQVARGGGVDFVVVGSEPGRWAGAGRSRWTAAFVVAPAEELQKVGRIDLVLRGPRRASAPPLVDAGGAEARELERAALRAAAGAAGRPSWRAGRRMPRGRSPAFVDARSARSATSWRRSWRRWQRPFVAAGQRVVLHQPADPAAAGAAARSRAGGGDAPAGPAGGRGQPAQGRSRRPPAPAGPGRLRGRREPAPAATSRRWRSGGRRCTPGPGRPSSTGARPAIADCVSCHVTGYGEVGGSSLGHLEQARPTCSARPATARARCTSTAEGLEEPPAVRLEHARVDLRALPQRETLRHLRVRRLPARRARPRPRRQGAREAGPRPHRPPAARRPRWPRPRRAGARRMLEGTIDERLPAAADRINRRRRPEPVSSWSRRSGSMLPPVMIRTTRRLGSVQSALQQGGEGARRPRPRRSGPACGRRRRWPGGWPPR